LAFDRNYLVGMKPRYLLIPLLAGLLQACSTLRSPDGGDTSPITAPDDFSLSLTMLEGEPGEGAREPAWYIVEPDGVLRAASGTRVATSPMPPTVRRLSRSQLDALCALCDEAGLLDRVPEGFVAAPEPPPEAPDWTNPDAASGLIGSGSARTDRIYIAHRGRRRSFVPLNDQPAARESLTALATELRALAWMNQ